MLTYCVAQTLHLIHISTRACKSRHGESSCLFEAVALTMVTQRTCLADASSLGAIRDAWHDAYLATPHGEPGELARQSDN